MCVFRLKMFTFFEHAIIIVPTFLAHAVQCLFFLLCLFVRAAEAQGIGK